MKKRNSFFNLSRRKSENFRVSCLLSFFKLNTFAMHNKFLSHEYKFPILRLEKDTRWRCLKTSWDFAGTEKNMKWKEAKNNKQSSWLLPQPDKILEWGHPWNDHVQRIYALLEPPLVVDHHCFRKGNILADRGLGCSDGSPMVYLGPISASMINSVTRWLLYFSIVGLLR